MLTSWGRGRVVLRPAVGLVVVALCAYLLFPVPTLTVGSFSAENGEPVMVVPLSRGGEFTIKYIHSVDRLPIYERFIVDDEYNLLLSEVGFIALGAGMADSGGKLVYDGQWTLIKDMDRELPSFYLRVSSIGEQTLFIDGRVIKLADIAPESGRLKFEIRKNPRVYLMLKGED